MGRVYINIIIGVIGIDKAIMNFVLGKDITDIIRN